MVISVRESNAINLLKTCLAVGIVLSHSSFYSKSVEATIHISADNYQSFDYFITVLQSLTCVCVPLFFFISGYLFFLNAHSINWDFFSRKIRKRFSTLMIPFFIANGFAFLLVLLANTIKPNIIPIGNVSLSTISISNLLSWLLLHPILGPTWFLRDLFSVVLISPIIYMFLKRKKVRILISITLLLLWGGCNYMNYNPLDAIYLNIYGVCFFSLGCAVSLSNKSLFFNLYNYRWICLVAGIVVILSIFVIGSSDINSEVVRLPLIISLALLYSCLCYHISTDKIMVWTQEASVITFFIYIYHGILVVVDKKLLLIAFKPVDSLQLLFLFLLTVCVLFAQLLLLYYVLKKYSPRLLAIMVGGR